MIENKGIWICIHYWGDNWSTGAAEYNCLGYEGQYFLEPCTTDGCIGICSQLDDIGLEIDQYFYTNAHGLDEWCIENGGTWSGEC